jgi:hypothetical protein
MASNADAQIWGVMGASGSGKGLWIKQQLRKLKPRRLVVWDFMSEYQEFTGEREAVGDVKGAPATMSLRQIRDAMKAAGAKGALRVRFSPKCTTEKGIRAEFEMLCDLVYAFEDCTFIAEELSNVTMPSWAPPSWRKMCTSGRHQRVHIIGTSQMPSLIDKAFLGNCTLIHCGPLREFNHRQAVAKSMDVDEGRLSKLVSLQFIEKDFVRGETATDWVACPGESKRGGRVVVPSDASPTARGVRRGSKVA